MRIIEHIRGYRSGVINGLIDAVRAQRIVPGHGLRAVESPGGTALTLAPSLSFPWPWGPQYAFGLSIAGADVTVYSGAIRVGGTAYVANETTITITSDGQYIGIAFDRGTGAATITGPHNARPAPASDVWADALYAFSFTNGLACLRREYIHDIRLEAGL